MSEMPQRIGDAERDAAVEALRAHHAAGRLDLGEFDDRMSQALSARTQDQLTPLFRDLPPVDGNPQALAIPATAQPAAVAEPAKPANRTAKTVMGVVSGLIWPAIIIANFAADWKLWWLFLIPIFVLPAIWGAINQNDPERQRKREAERQQWRELGG